MSNFAEFVDDKYKVQWFHKIIADKLQEAYEKIKKGEKSRIILEVPPRHGKSELATIKFPAWVLGQSPDFNIIVSSYAQSLAEDFGRKTRDIMQSEEYSHLFGSRLRDDSTAKAKWLTKENGGYTASGIGGGITGRGFNIGIIDDPFKDREQAESKTVRDKVWDWFTSTFYTRQEGAGAIIVICTRWHLDDLVGRIEALEAEQIEQGEKNFDEWEYITFPAIADRTDKLRNEGDVLWPEKFNIDQMNAIKNSIGTYDFSALYQQNPISQETQVFRKSAFKYFNDNDLKFRSLDTYTLIDPAISDATGADNWVVLTIAKEKNSPNIYRLEESAGKGNPDKMLQAIFYHQERYRSKVWLETISFQKILKRDIKEMQRDKEQYFTVHELKHAKNKTKIGRIQALLPLYEAGVIYHRKIDTEFEAELMEFPFGKHDDRIDAMSFLNEALFEHITDYDEPQPRRKSTIGALDPY